MEYSGFKVVKELGYLWPKRWYSWPSQDHVIRRLYSLTRKNGYFSLRNKTLVNPVWWSGHELSSRGEGNTPNPCHGKEQNNRWHGLGTVNTLQNSAYHVFLFGSHVGSTSLWVEFYNGMMVLDPFAWEINAQVVVESPKNERMKQRRTQTIISKLKNLVAISRNQLVASK